MNTRIEHVESFLKEFKAAMDAAGIIIIDREKNLQGMFDLEINPPLREKALKALEAKDYFRGPSMESGWIGEAWEFGKVVNGKEAYIKVSMGVSKQIAAQKEVAVYQKVICISFHPAEKPIKYPFKK